MEDSTAMKRQIHFADVYERQWNTDSRGKTNQFQSKVFAFYYKTLEYKLIRT